MRVERKYTEDDETLRAASLEIAFKSLVSVTLTCQLVRID